MSTENQSTYAQRNYSRFNPSKFIWLYDRSDVYENKEILHVDDLPVIHKATTIEQAKGQVRADIRLMGGNAGLYLSIEKESTIKKSWAYDPPMYEVSAYAALVVPKNLSTEKRQELLSRFKGNIRYSNELQGLQEEETEVPECSKYLYVPQADTSGGKYLWFLAGMAIFYILSFVFIFHFVKGPGAEEHVAAKSITWVEAVFFSPFENTQLFCLSWIIVLGILYMAWDSIYIKFYESKYGKYYPDDD